MPVVVGDGEGVSAGVGGAVGSEALGLGVGSSSTSHDVALKDTTSASAVSR